MMIGRKSLNGSTSWLLGGPLGPTSLDIERGPFHPREHASLESNINNSRRSQDIPEAVTA